MKYSHWLVPVLTIPNWYSAPDVHVFMYGKQNNSEIFSVTSSIRVAGQEHGLSV